MDKTILKQIKNKAIRIHKRYPELNTADLIQDGCELVLKLINKHGNRISLPYCMMAVTYLFNHKIRDSATKKGIRFCDIDAIDDEVTDEPFIEVNRSIDRTRFLQTLQNRNLKGTLSDLMAGYSVSEIATRRRQSKRTIYRHIELLKKYRERWET